MAWEITGNSGTNPNAPVNDFLGTTDNNALAIRTNNTERIRIDTSGNVGVGTSSPAHPLHLAPGKGLRVEGGTNAADTQAYFSFGGNGNFDIDAPGVVGGRFVVQNSGNVGIGVPNPGSKLDVNGTVAVGGPDNGFLTVSGKYNNPNGTQLNYYVGIGADSPSAVLSVSASAPGTLGPIIALTNTSGGVNAAAAIDFYTFDPGEGVGPDHLTSPSSRIQAVDDGNFANDIVFLSNKPGAPNNALVEHMRITSTGNVTVPGDIVLTGADCAEQFDLIGHEIPEPGTVVVIGENGTLGESRNPYDRKVAGVVSGAGSYRRGILLDQRPGSEDRVAVALLGKAYCKVDARYSPRRRRSVDHVPDAGSRDEGIGPRASLRCRHRKSIGGARSRSRVDTDFDRPQLVSPRQFAASC